MATANNKKLEEYGSVNSADYQEGESVTSARDKYNSVLNQKPGDFASQYTEVAQQAMDKYLNRDKFSYDLNGDALYQQYKNQFVNQGKLASQDVMGQAAAMTGGYGNSYAQSAGQQAYQGYLQQLNDKVPELYQLALDRYNQEGEALLNQYGLLSDRENTEYGRYRDTVADWNTERGFAADELHRAQEFDYSQYRDTVADSQWQAQFDESVRQYEQEYQLKVQEIEEAKRHNLISEDQAQQQIDLAKRELEASIAAKKASASKKADTYSLSDAQETKFYGFVENEDWAGADNYIEYLRSNGLSDSVASTLINSIPESYWNKKNAKAQQPLYKWNPTTKLTDLIN